MTRVNTASRDERLEQIHDRLVTAVDELTNSVAWVRMLQVAARFPRYSPSNVLLIAAQCPDATNVAGIRTWNSLGRRVRKGEKGIAILAPCLYKENRDEGTVSPPESQLASTTTKPNDVEQGSVLRGFRVVHVFDVSQTDGEPIPTVAPTLLPGEAPRRLWDDVARLLERDGYTVERGDCRGANGYTDFKEREVRVRDDVDSAQACKTLCHEAGHVRADHEDRFPDYHVAAGCRGIAEVEAESIAYVVTAAAGLDSTNYTVPYVAHWADGDTQLIKATASRVLDVARDIMDAIRLDPTPPAPPLNGTASRERRSLDSLDSTGHHIAR